MALNIEIETANLPNAETVHPMSTAATIDKDASALTLQGHLDDLQSASALPDGVYVALSNSLKRLHDFEAALEDDPNPLYVVAHYKTSSYFKVPKDADPDSLMVKWDRLHYMPKKGEKKKATDPTHGGAEESDFKRPDQVEFTRKKPWIWNGDPDVDSEAEDFDGGFCEFLV